MEVRSRRFVKDVGPLGEKGPSIFSGGSHYEVVQAVAVRVGRACDGVAEPTSLHRIRRLEGERYRLC